MANTTKRSDKTAGNDYDAAGTAVYPLVSTAATYYPNAFIGLTAAGYATKFDDTAALQFVGIVGTMKTIVDSGGSDGDYEISVQQPPELLVTLSSVAITDVGRRVYASDDQTASLTPGSYGNCLGVITKYASSTTAYIRPEYVAANGLRPAQVYSANGAVVLKTGTHFITKGTAAALTIAAPTTGVHDGMEITLISTTAAAHTITYATTGFNGGGTGTDVGTFGGAIGDGITLVAYGTNWLVKDKTNVTLA